FERSNTLYDSLAEAAGIDIGLDREPIGTLMLATDDAQLPLLADDPRMDGELLDAAAVLEAEPVLAAGISGGLLSPHGRRSDPGAITAAAAMAASAAARGCSGTSRCGGSASGRWSATRASTVWTRSCWPP